MSSSVDLRRALAETDVKSLVDVRLKVWSGNKAFSTGTRYTVEDAGLAYTHLGALGNLAYKTGGIEIKDISAIGPVVETLRQGYDLVLMCICPDVRECHRLALVEEVLRRLPGVRVVHLSKDGTARPHKGKVPEAAPSMVLFEDIESDLLPMP
jgi:uncharacterized protein (DUF488 family)